MAKFCEECGSELTTTGKFCGSCGAAVPVVIQNCPTCGHEWDGKKKALESSVRVRKVTASAQTKVLPESVTSVASRSSRVAHNTTAVIQPIYGPLYIEGKDCPNCGTANMANKTCKICESEN